MGSGFWTRESLWFGRVRVCFSCVCVAIAGGHCGSLFMGIMTLRFPGRAARAAARGALEGDGHRLDHESLHI